MKNTNKEILKKMFTIYPISLANYLFFIAICQLPFANCFSQTWSPAPGFDPRYGNKSIVSLAVYKDKLYVAGNFDSIGNIRTPKIAYWDNVQWDSVGPGLDVSIPTQCMVIYKNKLLVGGMAVVNKIGHVVSWDEIQWASIGISSSSPLIYSIVVYKNELYVGGQFTEMGGKTVNNIARWNGSTWNDVGGGVTFNAPTIVGSMAVYNGELYVGGCFGKAGTTLVNNLAKWDGTKWDSIPGAGNINLGGCVGNMLVDTVKNIFYMVGGFNYVNSTYTDGIAQYNGVNWSAVGNAPVPAGTMCMYHGDLYTSGGGTSTYGGKTLRYICRWDGTTWHSVGTGMYGQAKSMAVYNDELYVGGNILEFDGDTNLKYLAKWSMPVGVEEYKVQSSKFKVYPNPAHNELIVELEENIQGKKMQLCVFDNVGKEVLCEAITNTKHQTINTSSLSKGLYLVRLLDEKHKSIAVQKIVVE